MSKRILLLVVFALPVLFISAQPTQAEIDKMMKQAQELMKKYGGDSTKNKTTKEKPSTGVDKNDTAQYSLPSRNTKLLNALPIRTFTKPELVSYLHNLGSKLTEYLKNTYGTNISGFSSTTINQPGTPIYLWLKGSVNEAALISVKASESNADNNLQLNNAGGILTSCGLGFYGIPILQYVLDKQPGNNMILNNLGQAYLDLGDDKKAEEYLLKCVSSYKYYPDANLALAYIYISRGRKGDAISYAENSLRGAWSSNADNFLRKLKPDLKMMDYVRHRYKQPEYFEMSKYPLLEQCTNIATVYTLEPQYAGYNEMIDQVVNKYRDLLGEAATAAAVSVPEKVMAVAATKKSPLRPFGTFGNVVLQAMKDEYYEKFRSLDSFRLKYYSDRGKMNENYAAEYKKIEDKYAKMVYGDEPASCKEINALNNSYLPKYAEQTQLLQKKMLAYYKDYLNDMSYWSYIASVNDDQFHVSFYTLVIEWLARLKEINTTRFMESADHHFYPCQYEDPDSKKMDSLEIETPDCYLTPKIELNLGVMKMEISCETYKFEAGEGLIGKIEYDRSSGNVTLAFGVGEAVPRVFFHGPGVEGGLEAEVKSQLYITFDHTGTPSDLGVLWEAELKAVVEGGGVKGSIGLEEGVTAGFGSGVQIKEHSRLKEGLDNLFPVPPDDKQIDKRVPLYKKPGM